MDLKFVNKPEVMMGVAQDRFDAEGKLIHEPTRENIRKLLVALVEWAALLRR